MDIEQKRELIRSNLTEALRLLDEVGESLAATHIETALYAFDVATVSSKGKDNRPD